MHHPVLPWIILFCHGSSTDHVATPPAGKSTRNGIGSGAIIAIAVVGGIVVLVLATIIFCCCRLRWRNRASAIEAATLAKSQPKADPMTPTGPAPFAVNYPQFQVQHPFPPPPPLPPLARHPLQSATLRFKYSTPSPRSKLSSVPGTTPSSLPPALLRVIEGTCLVRPSVLTRLPFDFLHSRPPSLLLCTFCLHMIGSTCSASVLLQSLTDQACCQQPVMGDESLKHLVVCDCRDRRVLPGVAATFPPDPLLRASQAWAEPN